MFKNILIILICIVFHLCVEAGGTGSKSISNETPPALGYNLISNSENKYYILNVVSKDKKILESFLKEFKNYDNPPKNSSIQENNSIFSVSLNFDDGITEDDINVMFTVDCIPNFKANFDEDNNTANVEISYN